MRNTLFAMGFLAAVSLSGWASAKPSYEEREIARLSAPELEKFEDDRAFRRYLREVRAAERRLRNRPDLSSGPDSKSIVIAAVQDSEPQEEICTDPALCPEEGAGSLIVTGSRIVSQSQTTPMAMNSITNTQKLGVDEGDFGAWAD